MIAHISPSIPFYAESLSCVQFAARIHRLRRKKGGKVGIAKVCFARLPKSLIATIIFPAAKKMLEESAVNHFVYFVLQTQYSILVRAQAQVPLVAKAHAMK